MGRKKQDGQDEKKTGRWITPGRILALVIAAAVIIYMSFSVHVFYNFIKILITDPDAGKEDVSSVQMYEYADADGNFPNPVLSDFLSEELL